MEAYALVRHHNGGIDARAWREFAMPLIDGFAADLRPSTGIMVATRRGAARGLFVYVCLPHLRHGRVLLVPHAFCVEMLRTLSLWTMLLGEMNAIARDLRCGMVQLVVRSADADLASALRILPADRIPIELMPFDSDQ